MSRANTERELAEKRFQELTGAGMDPVVTMRVYHSIGFVMPKDCPIYSAYFTQDGNKVYCNLVSREKQTDGEYKNWKAEIDLIED